MGFFKFGKRSKASMVVNPKVEYKIVEKLIPIGDSVQTLYVSKSRMLEYGNSFTLVSLSAREKAESYNGKYWTNPTTPFEVGGDDVQLTQIKAILTADGKAYLLQAKSLITVEK